MLGCGVTLSGFIGQPAEARVWPNGAKGAVSLTYDDGYDSQLENAAPLLDHLGLKATFFLTVENIDERLPDWQALARNGHEIGNHTSTHPCRLRGYSAGRFLKEQIEPAEQYLRVNFPGPAKRCFAYPCGFEGLGQGPADLRVRRYQRDLVPNFLAARTVIGAPNDPRQVSANRYFLNGYEPTYDRDIPHPAFAYLKAASERGHWAILIFHEVLKRRRGEGDTSKAVHQAIIEHIVQQKLWCAPVRTVYEHLTGVA
jgi:peptidoglycan/xylan/chitin deacetylase (PgdA/CDA1 family)